MRQLCGGTVLGYEGGENLPGGSTCTWNEANLVDCFKGSPRI